MLAIDLARRQGGFTLSVAAEFPDGVTAIFGPSGSGKTTTLRCIAGLARPDNGSITLDGRVLFDSSAGVSLAPERRRVGLVFQDGALFPHLSVLGNIEFGYRLTRPAARRIEVERVMDLLELGPMAERRVTSLSGGERQRVALARALAASPELLLLDEPVASLDPRLRGTVLAYLRHVHEELDVSMVYVSHSPSEVLYLATHVLKLKDGRVENPGGFGPPSRVLLSDAAVAAGGEEGVENILEGRVEDPGGSGSPARIRVGAHLLVTPAVTLAKDAPVMLALRASDVIVAISRPDALSARNIIPATCAELNRAGGSVFATFNMGDLGVVGVKLIVELTPGAVAELEIGAGKQAFLVFKTTSISVSGLGNLPPSPS